MNTLYTTWKQSLAATALTALLAPMSGDRLLADEAVPPPAESSTLLALADDEEGDERRDRDGDRRERAEPDGERRERAERDRDGERGDRERDDDEGERDDERRSDRDREHGEEFERRIEQQHRALAQQAERLERALEQMRDRGSEAGIAQLERQLEAIRRQRRQFDEQVHRHHRLEELKNNIRRLHEAGRTDEARRLEQEAREVHRELAEGHRDGDGRPRGEGDGLERRAYHLRAAADNLAAAGMHEQADDIRRHVERMLREARGGQPDGQRREGGHQSPRDAEHHRGPAPEAMQREVQQLREQMHEMRRHVDEMRQMLKQLADQRRKQG